MAIIQHKRGVPFSKLGQWQNALKTPIEVGLGRVEVRSQIRTQDGKLVATCDVTYPTAISFKIRVANTDDWVIDRLYWDIKYIIPNQDEEVTETIFIDVLKEVTD
ncbi:hypothetical protein [Acinetobacter sp. CFCC 10889]|uniref:hypothetical protein n=1 Tax=Acinetobacter sp. CFCC 10889 TaxID=1775557 RepID=UPI000DCF77C9|nr:hypothetical protein [Acinetobacter sp. CFCC 10889]